jgi:hypothetical protein
MVKLSLATASLALLLAAGPAAAATVVDPTGDFLPSYTGTQLSDLDVTSLSVNYDAATQTFTVGWTLAGAVDASTPGLYVLGVNTGTGAIDPFGPIGNGNVIFDQALLIQKNGTGTLGPSALDPSTIVIDGNTVTLSLALALFPSTGFDPGHYGWNVWPRGTGTGLGQITDFAPNNATLAAVPEPGTWMMLLLGFAGVGMAMRRRRPAPIVASA